MDSRESSMASEIMSKKYNLSIRARKEGPFGEETFQVEGCDSFDEALKIVLRAIQEREVQLVNMESNSKPSTAQIMKAPTIPVEATQVDAGTAGTPAPRPTTSDRQPA